MKFRGDADPRQLAKLKTILDDFCELSRVPGAHPSRQNLARRLAALFGESFDHPDDILRELDDILKGFRVDLSSL